LIFSDEEIGAFARFIVKFDGILGEDVCDDILAVYRDSPLWKPATIGTDHLDTSVRNCHVLSLSNAPTDQLGRMLVEAHMKYNIGVLAREYKKIHPDFECSTIEDIGLLRYTEGGFYTQHTDSHTTYPRALTAIWAINEDYEGGEWGFFDNRISFKLNKGDAMCFPSNFMYPHQINPITKGTRYSAITWYR
jgi:predicted 2-oxoglutarate/Fe(II)-dependent dioxygenase YbiX